MLVLMPGGIRARGLRGRETGVREKPWGVRRGQALGWGACLSLG